MPIHEFRCQDCKAQFEVLLRPSTVPACPSCSSSKLEKLISPIAPAGKSAAIIAQARGQAARAGHLRNI